ncbi:LPXTG cell wall anchor domain-containing protein [Enterococcus sp. LJL120]
MKKILKRLKWVVVAVLLISGFSLAKPLAVAADGGSVKNGGQITFQEGTITSSTTDSTTNLPSTGGKLPQTGELIQWGVPIGGLVLIAFVLIIIWRGRRKGEEDDHEKSSY